MSGGKGAGAKRGQYEWQRGLKEVAGWRRIWLEANLVGHDLFHNAVQPLVRYAARLTAAARPQRVGGGHRALQRVGRLLPKMEEASAWRHEALAAEDGRLRGD